MIEGIDINLRLVEQRDLQEMARYTNLLSEAGQDAGHRFRPLQNFEQNFQKDGYWSEERGLLQITDKQDRLLGNIACFRPGPYLEGYELGYLLYRHQDRGKGLMTQAVRLFSSYLFAIYPIPRLQLRTSPQNTASRRIAEKCGFQEEGLLRRAVFYQGRYQDLLCFSMLREELPAPFSQVSP